MSDSTTYGTLSIVNKRNLPAPNTFWFAFSNLGDKPARLGLASRDNGVPALITSSSSWFQITYCRQNGVLESSSRPTQHAFFLADTTGFASVEDERVDRPQHAGEDDMT